MMIGMRGLVAAVGGAAVIGAGVAAPAGAASGPPVDAGAPAITAGAAAPGQDSAMAGPGEWDYVGWSPFGFTGDGDKPHQSEPGPSAGGAFRTCVYTSSTAPVEQHSLYEYDPGSNIDEFVRNGNLTGTGCIDWPRISEYVDGDNGRAEFYLRTNDSRVRSVYYYD